MKISTNVKAGIMPIATNHNEKLANDKKSLLVKSGVKSGGVSMQHNEKLTRGLKIKTGIKAGPSDGGGGSSTGH